MTTATDSTQVTTAFGVKSSELYTDLTTTISAPQLVSIESSGIVRITHNTGIVDVSTESTGGDNSAKLPTISISPEQLLDDTKVYLLYGAIAGGAALLAILIIVLIICCHRKQKRRNSEPAKPGTRKYHKQLSNTDSATVSISVQRVAGPPVAMRSSRETTPGSTPGSHRSRDTPRSQRSGYSPQQIRTSNMNGYSPQQRRVSEISGYSPKYRRPSNLAGKDGFTLSSSFEAGLDFDFSSSYNENHLTNSINLNRKGSTYDNVDDDTPNLLRRQAANKQTDRTSTYQKRRNTTTLPLHFSLFDGSQYSQHQNAGNTDEEPDYANVPTRLPTDHLSSNDRQRSTTIPERPPSVNAKTKSKYKSQGRRSSKTLRLFCNRKVPPVISKIERQVLEAVPIYGEPTPGTTPMSPPLEMLEFPPPPTESPPGQPVRSYVNPMYSPITAGTMSSVHMDSYFSV